jgi:hypothetical protein
MYCDPTGSFVITSAMIITALIIGALTGVAAGAYYGYVTAKANGDDALWGAILGGLAGMFMGAAAGVGSLFIMGALAGGVVIGGLSLSATAAMDIGLGIGFAAGFAGGFAADLTTHAVNGRNIGWNEIGSASLSGLRWGVLNMSNVLMGGLTGSISLVASVGVGLAYNFMFGAFGVMFDTSFGQISKNKKSNVNVYGIISIGNIVVGQRNRIPLFSM